MKRLEHIELLRFLAATAVIITHYLHFFNPFFSNSNLNAYASFLEFNENNFPFYFYLEQFYRFGYMGVNFFWQISGLVLAYSYIHKSDVTFRKFFINRFARLYPLHFITLLLIILLQYISLKITGSYQITDNNFYNGLNDLTNFILQLTFLSGWIETSKFSYNFPIWSVSIEILIYFIFFWTLRFIKKFKIILNIAILLIFFSIDKFGYNLFFVDCGRYFFSGVLVFLVFEKMKQIKYSIFLSFLLFAMSIIGNFKYQLFFSSVLLLSLVLDKSVVYNFSKKYSFFGNLTYSSYLLHVPIQLIILNIITYFKINFDIFTKKEFFLIYLFIVYFFAYYTYKFVENPLRKLIRKIY